jgi:hypothetical protein
MAISVSAHTMINPPLEGRDWTKKAVWLDQFAAPAFSGIVFVAGISHIARDEWPGAIFALSCVLSYWSRSLYLFWKQWKCIQP